VVRGTVEETLNAMLEAEADALCRAARYERSPERADRRAGHYRRKLQTKAGTVELRVPKLRTLPFETAIIERYRRREASVEEALIEMYLAGVSVRRVEDITEALWGERVSAGAVSDLNQKLYERIEAWRNRPITGEHAYVFMDGVWLKRTWGEEVRNVAVLIAIGVDAEGYREVLGVAEGMKEDAESWRGFLRYLKDRGLSGVRLVVSDKCMGLVEALGEFYPEAAWQRCVVHFYRNVFTAVPKGKAKEVAAMLKAIHAQEDRAAAREKAAAVAEKLEAMKLTKAAAIVRGGAEETMSYYAFPREHWRSLRTNNPLERIIKEIRRRTRVVGSFPDGRSALMLVAARLRHIAGTKWGTRAYLDMKRLSEPAEEALCAAGAAS
jgi:transposase-like protein